jgi:hypothetical protein
VIAPVKLYDSKTLPFRSLQQPIRSVMIFSTLLLASTAIASVIKPAPLAAIPLSRNFAILDRDSTEVINPAVIQASLA